MIKTNDKPVWQEVEIPKAIAPLEATYRELSKKAGAARDALAIELKSRLGKVFENDLSEDPSLEVAVSFNFGKISCALVPKSPAKKNGSKKAIKLA